MSHNSYSVVFSLFFILNFMSSLSSSTCSFQNKTLKRQQKSFVIITKTDFFVCIIVIVVVVGILVVDSYGFNKGSSVC